MNEFQKAYLNYNLLFFVVFFCVCLLRTHPDQVAKGGLVPPRRLFPHLSGRCQRLPAPLPDDFPLQLLRNVGTSDANDVQFHGIPTKTIKIIAFLESKISKFAGCHKHLRKYFGEGLLEYRAKRGIPIKIKRKPNSSIRGARVI